MCERRLPPYPLRRLDAVQVGQIKVDEDEVCAVLGGSADGLGAGIGFGYHLDVVADRQQGTHPVPRYCMDIGNDRAQRRATTFFLGQGGFVEVDLVPAVNDQVGWVARARRTPDMFILQGIFVFVDASRPPNDGTPQWNPL